MYDYHAYGDFNKPISLIVLISVQLYIHSVPFVFVFFVTSNW